MSALAIAHKKLDGDLINTFDYNSKNNRGFLYLDIIESDYVILERVVEDRSLIYISTTEQFINFKGNNMKTVMDAVNEFKGVPYDFHADWQEDTDSKHCYIEVITIDPNIIPNRCIGKIVNGGTKFNRMFNRLVCTRDEFLAAVAECETNFGKLTNKEHLDYIYGRANKDKPINSKTETTPTYTQEMDDNGILPSVGMECLTKKGHQNDSHFNKSYINGYSQDGKWLIFTDYLDNIESHHISSGVYDFKPLTPPITLIDGECYQGTHKGNGKLYKGVYVKSLDEICHGKGSNPSRFYVNIQPLTVKAKS